MLTEADKEAWIILTSISAVSFSILVLSGFLSSLSDTTIALTGVIVTVAIFIIERIIERYLRDKEDNDRMRRSCNTMLKEIDNHRMALVGFKPEEGRFVEKYFNTDAYQSLVSSGLFTYFEEETQDKLSDLYIRIKLHNDFSTYRNHYSDIFFLYSDSKDRLEKWRSKVKRYDDALNMWDTDICNYLGEACGFINKELSKY